MDRFTGEEINLMRLFDATGRAGLIDELREALPGMDEPDVIEITRGVIGKLEHMTDAEVDSTGFFPADEFYDKE